MRRKPLPFRIGGLSLLLVLSLAANGGADGESKDSETLQFLESFVLAPDRTTVLRDLIPGSEDYYFWHALHYQNLRDKEKFDATLEQWRNHHRDSDRREDLELREALLGFDDDPESSLAFLNDHFGPDLDHPRRAAQGEVSRYPSVLDPKEISAERFLEDTLARKEVFQEDGLFPSGTTGILDGASNTGLFWIAEHHHGKLGDGERRALLERAYHPLMPNLMPIVLDDFRTEESRGFGEFEIHKELLLSQLEKIRLEHPSVMDSKAFVTAWIQKLRPAWPYDLDDDPEARSAYLQRLRKFVEELEPSFNSLKLHVLHHLIRDRWETGAPVRNLFRRYLEIPRKEAWTEPGYYDSETHRLALAFRRDKFPETALGPMSNDEDLVRSIFSELFRGGEKPEPWTKYVRASWLMPVYAEALLTAGAGDPEQLASLLDPAAFEALNRRTDIDFARGNPKEFAPDDPVKLALDLKNVPTLTVKVFKLNALNYYRDRKQEIGIGIDLDGLPAVVEETHSYSEPPLIRTRREFEFPALAGKRGTWITEFTGNGTSSRVLVRKGRLQQMHRTGSAGYVFTVIDEDRKPVPNATLLLGGRRFAATAEGSILVPFSTDPAETPIILADGEIAALDTFRHALESYTLRATFHVEREALVAGEEATLALRPELWASGALASLELLKRPTLVIETGTLDGIESTQRVTDLEFAENRETLHAFTMPPRCRWVRFVLEGAVEQLSDGGNEIVVRAARRFPLNAIDASERIAQGFLATAADGSHTFELRGRNGEPIAHRELMFQFHHKHFDLRRDVMLSTDANGKVKLGALAGIAGVDAELSEEVEESWNFDLFRNRNTQPEIAYLGSNEAFRLAVSDPVDARRATLVEKRSGVYAHDATARLRHEDGFLVVTGLEAGEYHLHSPDRTIDTLLRVLPGTRMGDHVVGNKRAAPAPIRAPLQIGKIETDEDSIDIRLVHADAATRVHVVATHFLPRSREPDLAANLWPVVHRYADQPLAYPRPSTYASGRNLGDEYRYILERRQEKIYPGNMLPRPGLLLNPWDTSEASAVGRGVIMEAEPFKGEGKKKKSDYSSLRARDSEIHNFSATNIDFFNDPSPVIFNRAPDEDGRVAIERMHLRGRAIVRVFAQNAHSAATQRVVLDGKDSAVEQRDRRLRGRQRLDPNGRFVQRNAVSVLRKGDKLELRSATASDFEIYDTLERALGLFDTLISDLEDSFWLLADWPEHSDEEKREHYAKLASHEMHLFLAQKDPEFFDAVVRPYLRHKKDKTFLDRYLLGDDLKPWLEEWRLLGLNAAERVLLARHLESPISATRKDMRDFIDTQSDHRSLAALLFSQAIGAQSTVLSDTHALQAAFDDWDDVIPQDLEVSGRAYNSRKINETYIPKIDFNEVTLEEAIAFLREKAVEHDPFETDPTKKGINIILRHHQVVPGEVEAPEPNRITLKLSNVPFVEALRYVTELAGLKFRVEPFSIVITPQWDTGTDMFTRVFRVPPNFTNGNFSRRAAREILEAVGITFAEGASAIFQPQTSRLIVRNTQANMELVEAFVDSLSEPEPTVHSIPARLSARDDAFSAAVDDPFAADAAPEIPMSPANLTWDAENRGRVARFYTKLGNVREWAENNYYKVPLSNHTPSLVKANPFWLDAAKAESLPVLSPHFAFASSTRTDCLLALALLDLPFAAPNHESVARNDAIEFTAGGNAILFHREYVPAKKIESPLMVARHFFRTDDRYHFEGGQRRTKILREDSEFIKGAPYGCQIVITNPSDVEEEVDLLMQIPEGTLPLSGGRKTLSMPIRIRPFSAHDAEMSFYFPESGTFAQYPIQVSREDSVLASSAVFTFEVRDRRTEIDKESWSDIAQFGSADEVLAFLKSANLHRIDLEEMFWRLKDKAFFEAVIRILRERQTYVHPVYAYGFLHGSKEVLRQYLTNDSPEPIWGSGWHEGALLDFDTTARQLYQHLEYDPFVNARAHPMGGKPRILNTAVQEQVVDFLALLASKPQSAITDDDRLSLVYFLLLQDRVAEALPFFDAIAHETLEARLQYDYAACYLAFSRSEPDAAVRIANAYKEHPVERWRERFAEVIRQAEEARKAELPVAHDAKKPEDQHDQLANAQPTFDFKVEDRKIMLTTRKLKEVTLNYYEMDLEFLFSAHPFLRSDFGRFSFVEPSESFVFDVPEDGTSIIPLPKRFHQSDVLVEITGGGKKKAASVFDNELNIAIARAYGRLRVTHAETGKPVSKTYVKVYALRREAARADPLFYKDGYTDLRGKFDYATLNSGTAAAEIEDIASFAILVMSPSHGSEVREVDGPFGGHRIQREPPPPPPIPAPEPKPRDPLRDNDDPFGL